MEHFSTMFSGLAKSLKKVKSSGKCGGRGAVETMVKEAKKNDLILRSSGTLNIDGSNNFAAISSKRGNKGVNQDRCIVWEVIFGRQLASLATPNFVILLVLINCQLCKCFVNMCKYTFNEVHVSHFSFFGWVGIWMPRRHDVLWDI